MIGIIRRYKVKVSSTYKFSYFQGIGGTALFAHRYLLIYAHCLLKGFERNESRDNVNNIVYHENIRQRWSGFRWDAIHLYM